MQALDLLNDKLSSYLEPAEVKKVLRAHKFAERSHDGQFRQSGDPYIVHPIAVAIILAEMHMDHESLMAAMLHDVIEDTGVTKTQLSWRFGKTVSELVDGVSKLSEIEFASKAEQQAENFQKMALAMARDIRVILVKLADRLHNMRTLGVLKPEKRRRIARETLEIYAPLAQRLGMNDIRIEFEDLGFAALYPLRHARITKALNKTRGHRNELVTEIKQVIEHQLADPPPGGHVHVGTPPGQPARDADRDVQDRPHRPEQPRGRREERQLERLVLRAGRGRGGPTEPGGHCRRHQERGQHPPGAALGGSVGDSVARIGRGAGHVSTLPGPGDPLTTRPGAVFVPRDRLPILPRVARGQHAALAQSVERVTRND